MAYHGRMRGALPALEEQYTAISVRLSHVYCFIMNDGAPEALITRYGYTLLAGLPNSWRSSLRSFAQLGTHGVLTRQGQPLVAFFIQLYTGEPSGQTQSKTNLAHRKFMDRLTMEKAPPGMPHKYATQIGIPELNRAFEWLKAEPLWETQQLVVRQIQNVQKPVCLNMVNVLSNPDCWIISKNLYQKLSHRPAKGNLEEAVMFYQAMYYFIMHHLTKLT